MSLASFTAAYIECALWSSTDEDDIPMDSAYTTGHLSEETRAKIAADCAAFYGRHCARWTGQCERTSDDWDEDAMAGHDFWLTRNGHGAGFWDGDWGDAGDYLTEACKALGEVSLYIGDDRQIWCSP